MVKYIARTSNAVHSLYSDEELEYYFSHGLDILRRDESGDTLIATNGEWLEPKPDIEQSFELTFDVPADVTAQIRQNSADVAYISMMTGVDL